MRILYLHQYFNTPQMSGGTRSYEMARRLVAWGHEVYMITSWREGNGLHHQGWYETNEEGIHVYWLPVPYANAMPYWDRMRAFLKFAFGATLKAAALPVDIVFATSTPLTIAVPAVYAARRQKVPMVFEVRDLWPEIPIAIGALKGRIAIEASLWLERWAYRHAANIIALSPGMKTGIIRTGYPENKVHVIPNGADLELFTVPLTVEQEFRRRFEWLQDRPLVVYTGALGMMNGVEYLAHLAAATRLLMSEARFLVVGSGKEWNKVRQIAHNLGVLNQNFFMLDSLPKMAIPAVLAAANIATSLFIDLPEIWVNSANKFFDALASGTPLAVNYRGWQAELLEESGAGLVLDVQDVEQSAARLVEALKNPAWLAQAGKAARDLAEKRFSRDKLARDLEAILISTIEQ